MNWRRKILKIDPWGRTQDAFQDEFYRLWREAGYPQDIALFGEGRGTLGNSCYYWPESASGLGLAIASHFDAEICEEPDRMKLIFLVGPDKIARALLSQTDRLEQREEET